MFYHIVSDVEIKIDEKIFPNDMLFFKNNECLLHNSPKHYWFGCRNDLYWSVFKIEFNMTYIEIQSFTKIMVERYFKMKISKPSLFVYKMTS